MKKITLFTLVTALLLGIVPMQGKVIHLLPKPQKISENSTAGAFALGREVRVVDETNSSALLRFLEETDCTVSTKGTAPVIEVTMVDAIAGAHDYVLYGYDNEAYTIAVEADKISITAVDPVGVIRAAQTLTQLAEGYEGATPAIEAVNITDWPAFKLRGLMHDVGRSFLSVDEIKKELDLLSRFKVNTFHFHLTENQAWRFEVKQYPALTANSSMTRFEGKYYTQEQCREIEQYAAERGIIVIPEIDMPGHSGAFERAMGCTMQSTQGVEILKNVLDEVVEVFPLAPYIHIGADEVSITNSSFLSTMTTRLHNAGKKVVCWNPIANNATISTSQFDMTQMWSSSGKKIAGLPNIDCRYNYVNHFDVYADLVGIYKSSIYYAQQGSAEVAGTITAVWNDRKTPTEEDIIKQNNVYANTLASAERAWIGGGEQYIEEGGTILPNEGEEFEEFADWERRFLFHKANSLKDEPIPYVKQTNIQWRITDAFPNNGNKDASFPPEEELKNSYEYNGKTYNTNVATGGGIYLRHTWGTTVPGHYSSPQSNHTAYAWTWVYSPVAQTVGAQIEFQNYGRSEKDDSPVNGTWDHKGSKVWVNGEEILPPTWTNSGKNISDNEQELLNENFTARPVTEIELKEGWNKVLLKLPYIDLDRNTVRLNKWMFTFVLTTLDGKNAVEDLVYSASDPDAYSKTTLINAGDHGAKWWRIPALEAAADGSVVAVFDKRYGERTDLPNPISIVAMRSTDNGRTWSDPVFVAERGNGKTYGDAALVLDTVTNELVCLFVGDEGFFQSNPSNRAVVYCSKSADHGKTWSTPRSLNEYIYTGSRSNWYAAFAGSGGMLQMENGRLMAVLCVRPNSSQSGYVDNWTIYSDDHGDTWKISNNHATASGNEAKVVEMGTDTVLMSIRNPGGGMRRFCKSTDGGLTWGESYLSETLKDANCNGDILRYNYNGKRYLLHSLNNSSSQRRDVSIFVSKDDGENWEFARQLVDGYAAYSSLAVLKDGTLGCLIEEGHDGAFGKDSSFNIVYHHFTMDWVLDGLSETEGGEEATGTLVCNGSDRYMSIADHDDFDMPAIASNQYTIALRVRKDQQTSIGERFVGKRANRGNGYEVWGVYNTGTNDFDFAVNTTPSYSLPGSVHNSFDYGEWNHVCWVFDGPNKKSYYYINGNLAAETSITTGATSTTSLENDLDVLVGCGYDFNSTNPNWHFDGEIDDLHFYKSALTAAQVTADMSAFDVQTAKSLNLVAAYDFANIDGTIVPDISGNNHPGTLHGYTVAPEEGKYKTPAGTMDPQGKAYVKQITSEGAERNINLSFNATPDNIYQLLGETIEVKRGGSFSINLVANEAGPRSSTVVYQDLRYCQVYVFTDWNADGKFVQEGATIGVHAPQGNADPNNVLANYDTVMDLDLSFTVPADAVLGDTRIRVIYNSAWKDAPTANSTVLDGGMAYDFPIKVTATTAIDEVEGENVLLYYANGTIYTNVDAEIFVYNATGNLVRYSQVAPVDVSDLASGIYVVRVNGKTVKFVK